MSTDLERLIGEEIEQSERNRDYPLDPAKATRPGREAARVYSVRLSPDVVDELERLGKDLDVPTSALIRGFIAQGLADSNASNVSALIDKLEGDLARLRGLVGTAR